MDSAKGDLAILIRWLRQGHPHQAEQLFAPDGERPRAMAARLNDFAVDEANLRAAAREALTVLTRLADSAHRWAGRDVPVGIVAEIDAAKARLAGALSREARP